MRYPTRFTRTALSTLAVSCALLVGSQPSTAEAAPSAFLTAVLEQLADEFGDGFGHIVGQRDDGSTVYVSVLARRGYVLYTAGSPVGYNDTLAYCEMTLGGGLSSCEEAHFDDDDDDYDCDWDEYQSWCYCSGYKCAAMFRDMCTEGGDWHCDGGECICEA